MGGGSTTSKTATPSVAAQRQHALVNYFSERQLLTFAALLNFAHKDAFPKKRHAELRSVVLKQILRKERREKLARKGLFVDALVKLGEMFCDTNSISSSSNALNLRTRNLITETLLCPETDVFLKNANNSSFESELCEFHFSAGRRRFPLACAVCGLHDEQLFEMWWQHVAAGGGGAHASILEAKLLAECRTHLPSLNVRQLLLLANALSYPAWQVLEMELENELTHEQHEKISDGQLEKLAISASRWVLKREQNKRPPAAAPVPPAVVVDESEMEDVDSRLYRFLSACLQRLEKTLRTLPDSEPGVLLGDEVETGHSVRIVRNRSSNAQQDSAEADCIDGAPSGNPIKPQLHSDDERVRGILSIRTRREARQKMLQRKTAELLDELDLHRLLGPLKAKASLYGREGDRQQEVINYECFREVLEDCLREAEGDEGERDHERDHTVLAAEEGTELTNREVYARKFGPFFTARSFLKFGSLIGEIGIVPFFSYVVRKVNNKQTRIMSELETRSQEELPAATFSFGLSLGYLREKDVENFIFELIPTLPQLQQLQEEFYPFYVFTAVRKFFFFLDPKRTGKIWIRNLLVVSILPELYELRAESPNVADESNWFSVENALRVYGQYLELDTDQNGMLSPSELGKYGSGMLTDEIIGRVFEEYQTYRDESATSQEMDYKTFLDFVLAMKHLHTTSSGTSSGSSQSASGNNYRSTTAGTGTGSPPSSSAQNLQMNSVGSQQSIRYLWKLIDINHDNRVTSGILRYFLRGILRHANAQYGGQPQSAPLNLGIEDVIDEIFDMIRPANKTYIQLEDILHNKMGVTMLSILTDAAAFIQYDSRENTYMDDREDMELQ
eukprot:g15031.t1